MELQRRRAAGRTGTRRCECGRGSCSRATSSWTCSPARRRPPSSTTEPRCPPRRRRLGDAPRDPRRCSTPTPAPTSGRCCTSTEPWASGRGGAEAVNRTIPLLRARLPADGDHQRGAARRRAAPRHRRLLRGQARAFGALADSPEALKDLVTDLNVTAGALARQDSALAASVPALRDTLRVGYPALGDGGRRPAHAARVLARGASPGCAPPSPTLDAGIPWIAQATGARAARTSCAAWPPTCARRCPAWCGSTSDLVPLLNASCARSRRARNRCWSPSPSPRSPASSRATRASRSAARSTAASWAWPARAASRTPTRRCSTSRACSRRTSPGPDRAGRPARPEHAAGAPARRGLRDPGPADAGRARAAPAAAYSAVAPVKLAIRKLLARVRRRAGPDRAGARRSAATSSPSSGLRFPLVEEAPKRLEVELSDAQAVQPGQGQIRAGGRSRGRPDRRRPGRGRRGGGGARDRARATTT